MPVPRSALAVCTAAVLGACADSAVSRPRVLVAASFADAAARVWGDQVVVVPEASSTAARQIVAGAPASCFVSADREWMDFVAERGLLAPGTRRPLVGNRLVVVAPLGSADAFPAGVDLVQFLATFRGRVALGDPQHVPAGRYARRALERLGSWRELRPRVIPTADVRGALALVEQGEVDLGVVYRTDAQRSRSVRVVFDLPADPELGIVYEVATLRGGDPAVQQRCTAAAAQAIYRELGFESLPR